MAKKSKCPPGQIERVGYHRRGYYRRPYTRRSGEQVRESYVSESDVSPICVKDMGKLGKGPRTLPPLKNDIHLRDYGYAIHKPANERHAALIAASKDNPTLEVLRRLNLIRNYQPVPEIKKLFSDDVEFMKGLYAERKEQGEGPGKSSSWANRPHSRSKSNSRSKSKSKSKSRRNQKGGQSMENTVDPKSESSPDDIDFEEQIYGENLVCDTNRVCVTRYKIYEVHNVDGREVIYYTLTDNDADDVWSLDKLYLDSDEERSIALNKLQSNPNLLIGIKVDGTLEGYCQYEPIDSKTVKIIWFCANKGYGRPLYLFMERFFIKIGFEKISLTVSLEGSHATRRINFWYLNGFVTYESIPDNKKIYMEKYL